MNNGPGPPYSSETPGALNEDRTMLSPNGSNFLMATPPLLSPLECSSASTLDMDLAPGRLADRNMVSEIEYGAHLKTVTKKAPLQAACDTLQICHTKRANLEWLRQALIRDWYPRAQPAPSHDGPSEFTTTTPHSAPISTNTEAQILPSDTNNVAIPDITVADEEIMQEYRGLESIFGALGTGGPEDDGLDEELEDNEDDYHNLADDAIFQRYQTSIRMAAAKRTEKNRRASGRKMQKCIEKSWEIFKCPAIEKKLMRDGIVDEHLLLLFIEHSANRCKRNRRGEDYDLLRM